MNRVLLTAVIAAGTGFAAIAQDNAQDSGQMKLSQAECSSLWNQLSPGGTPVTEAQAGSHVTDFKAANPDGDGTIDQAEFTKACDNGLVKSSAASGAATGETGASGQANQPSELHPPTNRVGEEVPEMKSDENTPNQ